VEGVGCVVEYVSAVDFFLLLHECFRDAGEERVGGVQEIGAMIPAGPAALRDDFGAGVFR
jgi:hypothetical protein